MAVNLLDLLFRRFDSLCRQISKSSRNQQRTTEPHHRWSPANRSDLSSRIQRIASGSFEISFTISISAITPTTAAAAHYRRETHVSLYESWLISTNPPVEILCFHVVIDDVPRTRLPVITYDENKENTPCMVTSSHKHLLDDEDDDLVDPRFSVHASNKRHYSLLLSR